MTRKSALYALAVVVLTGSMAVGALAGDYDKDMYGPPDASLSSDPERSIGQVDVGEIREPVETGAIPDLPGSSSDLNCCSDSGDPTFRPGGP